MSLSQFNEEQCKIFINDSKTYYINPETTSFNIIRWKFMSFLSHPSFHLIVSAGDTASNAGRAVLNLRTLNIHGHQKLITQVTDLLAVKTKASLVTFIDLIKQYGLLGTDCVLHTSNENSEKIYSSFFKFKKLFALSAFSFPLRPQNLITFFRHHPFLSKIISLYSFLLCMLMKCIDIINPITISNNFSSDEMQILLRGFTLRENSLQRSEEFLMWRYANAPYVYKTYIVLFRNNPIGILVTRLTHFQGVYFFLIMDYLGSAPIGALEGFGLRLSLISEAIAQKVDAIFGLFNRQNKDLASFYQFPFISINDKMLPHGSPIFASSIAPTLKTEELERMYFSLGDLDYF